MGAEATNWRLIAGKLELEKGAKLTPLVEESAIFSLRGTWLLALHRREHLLHFLVEPVDRLQGPHHHVGVTERERNPF